MKSMIQEFYEQLRKDMENVANENGISKQVEDTWQHSAFVFNTAYLIAKKAIKNISGLDLDLLERGCFAHDFGRMVTGSKASIERLSAIRHGVEGKKFFEQHNEYDNNQELARICERHMGGTGLIKEINIELGLSDQDTLAETDIEKIIGYSDWRTHAELINKEYKPKLVRDHAAYQRSKKWFNKDAKIHDKQKNLIFDLMKYIHKITDGCYGIKNPAKIFG
jgi:putative nucleotidyltransferase with HDIG domain